MAKKSWMILEQNKEKILFWLEKKALENKMKIIDFDKLVSTTLLKTFLKKDDKEVIEFLNKINFLISESKQIIFNNLIVDFELNPKFSFDKKIPFILENQEESKLENKFEIFFNEEIKKLIEKKSYVEFLPNLILYFSETSNCLKIYIKKDYFNN
ncbi:MSC_0623 family F1-like ATPase-associated protein [Metamycoplasma alkalescens]|nr:DUF2714 domain-containing protein [Metamycoplasma alkalescens]